MVVAVKLPQPTVKCWRRSIFVRFWSPKGWNPVITSSSCGVHGGDTIRTALIQNEIGCGIHYPVPLHLQPALSYLGYRSGDFPNSEELADTVLSLPMHPTMSGAEIARTVEVVTEALTAEPKSFVGESSSAPARVSL
jgi:hypothetical protein